MFSEVVDLFTELAALPSPPGEERPVADVVIGYLRDLGLSVDEDDAGAKVGSNIGNLYCRLEATDGGSPIFLCAHLDTVPPRMTPTFAVVSSSIRPSRRSEIARAAAAIAERPSSGYMPE